MRRYVHAGRWDNGWSFRLGDPVRGRVLLNVCAYRDSSTVQIDTFLTFLRTRGIR